jgi:hypothetical protein
MRLELIALAICLMLAGGIFALQGLNILPGSFMTGRPEWTVIGALGVLAGAVLLAFSRRGKSS